MDIFKTKQSKKDEVQDESQLAESLQFLEDVLKEEDPDFMKSVGEISIEAANIPEFAEEPLIIAPISQSKKFLQKSDFLQNLFKPFLIHKYPKQALTFWLIIAGLSFAIVKLKQSQIWFKPSKLFLTSYADLGVEVNDYDMLNEVEAFYDNVRFSKNLISLVKLTANIRPSESSSNNPMISFEVVLQGVSNEPIVEIKDREAEFRDIVLRVVEDFSYDDLETAIGKQNLSEAILARVNANLTDGQVRKVYYKNFVIKP